VQFNSCHLDKCRAIGKDPGYKISEVKSKFRTISDEFGSSLTRQLILDGSLGNGEIVAMFATPIEWDGQKMISARCPYSKEISEFLKKVSKSTNPQDYIYNVGDHRKADCAAHGYEKDTPGAGELVDIEKHLAEYLKK
jgi:hypothetical protein